MWMRRRRIERSSRCEERGRPPRRRGALTARSMYELVLITLVHACGSALVRRATLIHETVASVADLVVSRRRGPPSTGSSRVLLPVGSTDMMHLHELVLLSFIREQGQRRATCSANSRRRAVAIQRSDPTFVKSTCVSEMSIERNLNDFVVRSSSFKAFRHYQEHAAGHSSRRAVMMLKTARVSSSST
jgi:hypothetical protein